MSNPINILNYGGGWQTVGICILIVQGKIRKPDRIYIADTGREKSSTWRYLEETTQPRMAEIGIDIEIAPRTLSYVDLYAHNGDLLLPVYTPTGKLSAFCSDEWKAQVIERYRKLRELGFSPDAIRAMPVDEIKEHMKRSIDRTYVSWIGFAADEYKRIKNPAARWFPLIELMLTKADVRALVTDAGWPPPTQSSCWMCPNMTNAQWREVRDTAPNEFARACAIDEDTRAQNLMEIGIPIYLHQSRVPLRDADLDAADGRGEARQCGLGMCML